MKSGQHGSLNVFDVVMPMPPNAGWRGSMFRIKQRPRSSMSTSTTHRKVLSSNKGLSLDVAGRSSLPRIVGSTRPTIRSNKKYRFAFLKKCNIKCDTCNQAVHRLRAWTLLTLFVLWTFLNTPFRRSPPKPTLGSGGGWNWRKINGSRLVSQNTMMIRQKVCIISLYAFVRLVSKRFVLRSHLYTYFLYTFISSCFWKYCFNMITRFQCFHKYICTVCQ